MYSAADTIVALATPPGRGGLAVVRLSGRRAFDIARRLVSGGVELVPRRATLVQVVGEERGGGGERVVDEGVATAFAGPASYTGEDVVELSLHGSPVLVEAVIGAAVRRGARVAGRGEFTLRAFLNGRLDLTRAEAVADLVGATTGMQAAVAFDQVQGTLAGRLGEIESELFGVSVALEASVDFPEEEGIPSEELGWIDDVRGVRASIEALLAAGRRGRVVREGATVALVGRANVGKSTLFNKLLGVERAIVSATAGTTRDVLSEVVEIEGIPVRLVDTAGLGAAGDVVEREGVRRAERVAAAADVVVVVVDGSVRLAEEDTRVLGAFADRPAVVAVSKCDLAAVWPDSELMWRGSVLRVSGVTGSGLDGLYGAIAQSVGGSGSRIELPGVSNARQIALLERARAALLRVEGGESAGGGSRPREIVLADIADARGALEEVTGKRVREDLLEAIFSRFCVGK